MFTFCPAVYDPLPLTEDMPLPLFIVSVYFFCVVLAVIVTLPEGIVNVVLALAVFPNVPPPLELHFEKS